MNFFKVSLLFSSSTISKLLAGLIIVKIIAITIGADGLGRLGQFMSLMFMVNIMAGGGITSGIVKYVSEFKGDQQKLNSYLGAASFVTLAASLLIGTGLYLASGAISEWLFGTPEYQSVIRILSIVQFLIALANLFSGLVNGHQRVTAFAGISIASVSLGATGVGLGCLFYGMTGAMYGLMWMAACPVLFLLPWYRIGLRYPWSYLYPRWDQEKVTQFIHFSAMLLASVLAMQMAQIIVRKLIEQHSGLAEVGYWQAVTKISDVYLQFITVILANYFLPRIAELKLRSEIKKEVNLAHQYAMPILFVMSMLIFLFRDPIILLLFSREFLPMKEFFTFQLIGDSFKIAAYICTYVAVAKANTKLYMAAEIYQALVLVLLCYLFIDRFGGIGATYAYCLHYVLYFLMVNYVLRSYFNRASET